MKLITTLCAVIAVGCAVEQEVYTVSPETLSNVKKIAMPCAQENNVDPINIYKLGDNTLPRDANTNKFLHCFATNSGFVDKDGHIVVEKVASALKNHPRVEEFKAAIKICAEITKEDPVATTVANHICYCENAPLIFKFTE